MLPPSVTRHIQRVPEPRTRLFGRASSITTVLSLLASTERSTVTISGPGGVGKTRLALQIVPLAREYFRDGVIFVPLAAVRGEQAVLRSIGQAIDLHDRADASLFDRVVDYLHGLDVLLVLDNFEHVLEEAVTLDRLMEALPSARAMVTSQARLNLSCERVFTLEPLAIPPPDDWTLENLDSFDAVQLFVDRARAVQPDFALTAGNAGDVAGICRALDGLPLAIELAAARIGVLPPRALNERIVESRFETLRTGPRDSPERHQALHATIAWSYGLLHAREQRLLQRLTVFAGGFPISAVVELSGDAGDGALDVLSSLVEKNLLRLFGEVAGEPRYLMLETIRHFARERLSASGEENAARLAHARWCLGRVGQPDYGLDNAAHAAWVERLTAEHENLRAALAWSIDHQPEIALRLANGLWLFWYVQGHLAEGQQWMRRAIDAGNRVAPDIRALALNNLGNLHYELGELDRAASLYEESREMWQAAGDEIGVADSLNNLGMLSTARGDFGQARSILIESLNRHRRLDDLAGVLPTLNNLGDLAIAEGDGDAAWRWNSEALALSMELGSARRMAHSTLNLGVAQRCQGNDAAGVTLLERSLAMFQEARDQSGIAIALQQLACAAIRRGDIASASAHLSRALALHRRVLDRRGLVLCLQASALVAGATGSHQQCATILGAADRIRGEMQPLRSPADRQEIDAITRKTCETLGAPAFTSAHVTGATLGRDDAIAYALSALAAPPTVDSILTRRELEVLRMIAQGASNSEIADALYISLRTVKAHVTNIFAKLDLTSRAAAVAYAYQHDLA